PEILAMHFPYVALKTSGRRAGRASRTPGETHPVADRRNQLGAVHRIEMEFLDPEDHQVFHLPGGEVGGDGRTLLRILVMRPEPLDEPCRHARSAQAGELPYLRQIVNRQDAGHDRDSDAGGADPFQITLEGVIIEE